MEVSWNPRGIAKELRIYVPNRPGNEQPISDYAVFFAVVPSLGARRSPKIPESSPGVRSNELSRPDAIPSAIARQLGKRSREIRYFDYKVAAQGYHGWRYPHVLGVDVAGVIETIGEGVVSWNSGDQVFYHTTWRKDGSYAEFNVAPAHTFARVPEGISFIDAATLPCAALTACCALSRRLHVREGDIVLVHAAAGGVGGFAVQMAKAARAFVIGTCSASNAK